MVFRTILLGFLLALQGCSLKQAPKLAATTSPEPEAQPFGFTPPTPNGPADFQSQILPVLVKRCSPCHFRGGKMYSRLPFDRQSTIQQLGTRLFTRIERPEEQALILRFLAQNKAAGVAEEQPTFIMPGNQTP
jgi:hypothetical protein